jgi:hypothetical protein
MIYKSWWNHKGNRETYKNLIGCLIIVFQVCDAFSFPSIDSHASPFFGGSHLTHFFIFSNNSTFCGCANSKGLQFLFEHEIQRSTLQKFVDFWDNKCWLSILPILISQLDKKFQCNVNNSSRHPPSYRSLIFSLHLLHGSQTMPDLFSTLVMWFLNYDPLEVIQPRYVINV